ncbi:hypothetical protein SERLA73DRAFT_127958 [Serpula lacrymans var. lacrymans S7.3]|uniref:F-box domain-containing protein n=2 Tax=Serpula lacrymans var. lacrymans TaxID=341189 RepID=F8QIM9_SERL3|nr:uncharacterized protein SERLADRAFT_368132 [Serpula lacrymans var. lacrymans S7.9]EGN91831.1 hypothetical protein SERLA73DRAFT_127958 [Serpula lacrymans var. lacrymans S7.3]EGO26584.1 hypothetical protein SERLADRAFT_368132 [Serpula lacrymans var. lacrymans S7.9]
MDKFTTLEPVRLYVSGTSTSARAPKGSKGASGERTVGRLPRDLHVLVLSHLPIPDIPSYSRCSRATAKLAREDRIWDLRWAALQVDTLGLSATLDEIEAKLQPKSNASRSPPTIPVHSLDDDFGDFTTANSSVSLSYPDFPGFTTSPPQPMPSKHSSRARYMRAHNILKQCLTPLSSPPHTVLSELSELLNTTLIQQSRILHLLSLFLSPRVQPVRAWVASSASLHSAIDRFDSGLLTAFDTADSKGDEVGMRDAAQSSWEVWTGQGDWEMGKVWAEKREIFYEQGRWDPLANFTQDGLLDFDAMDSFMTNTLSSLEEHGARAVRVFPPASRVLLGFAERVATEVVGEYISPLLTRAREISNEVYLKATAASFREAWRIVEIIEKVSGERKDSNVSRSQAEDVVYRMYEVNMDEYLDEEVESLKQIFEVICRRWENTISGQATKPINTASATRFLNSHNPAQVKRNVLASFTDILLLPVTIVPRTVGAVGAVLTTGGNAAVQGIAMLNPQRWVGGEQRGYSKDLEKDDMPDGVVFEIGEDISVPALHATNGNLDKLDLLLSLDVSLELIHADREALKRAETFAAYPGHYGHRVRDTIEEIFILMLQGMSGRHIAPGFQLATEQMTSYKPAEHEETTSVDPLLQFFELVHVGDTIQSMVQVYFDKELAPHIDRTDFLNAVVREKKRFENVLDDSVAAGLNAGTQVLMNQVEHIILTLTKPREYYPPEDAPLELGPTQGCTEAIKCLETHCKLLKGSTSKEVLEVFYQEVGIRLIGILQKHIKRQIISLNGGFQVIADLNAYYTFISSLKVSSITADFSHLKMLGHVFVVEDAKDLAQIVRDVTRYGGAYRPEDVYEFIQRRSDWKKIEKTVDKTMYNLSFKDDCIIS